MLSPLCGSPFGRSLAALLQAAPRKLQHQRDPWPYDTAGRLCRAAPLMRRLSTQPTRGPRPTPFRWQRLCQDEPQSSLPNDSMDCNHGNDEAAPLTMNASLQPSAPFLRPSYSMLQRIQLGALQPHLPCSGSRRLVRRNRGGREKIQAVWAALFTCNGSNFRLYEFSNVDTHPFCRRKRTHRPAPRIRSREQTIP